MVYYFCNCMSLHVSDHDILFRITVWPVFGKEAALLAFWLWCFDFVAVALSLSFFPVGVLDGRY